jgi:hypothetical protein
MDGAVIMTNGARGGQLADEILRSIAAVEHRAETAHVKPSFK